MGLSKGATLAEGLGICVVVDYVSNLRDVHYQTGFVFLLLKKDGIGWTSFDLNTRSVSVSELVLLPYYVGRHIT
jgi:hypothetical protein